MWTIDVKKFRNEIIHFNQILSSINRIEMHVFTVKSLLIAVTKIYLIDQLNWN